MSDEQFVEKLMKILVCDMEGQPLPSRPGFGVAPTPKALEEARDTLIQWMRSGIEDRQLYDMFNEMVRTSFAGLRGILEGLDESDRIDSALLQGTPGEASADDVVVAIVGGGLSDYWIHAEVVGTTLRLSDDYDESGEVPIGEDGQVDLQQVAAVIKPWLR